MSCIDSDVCGKGFQVCEVPYKTGVDLAAHGDDILYWLLYFEFHDLIYLLESVFYCESSRDHTLSVPGTHGCWNHQCREWEEKDVAGYWKYLVEE